jgi:hypothetical protein
LTVSGTHLFLADGTAGLMVYNISNPATPELCGSYNTPGQAGWLTVNGDTAFVADTYYFGIYDCSQALSAAPLKPASTPHAFFLSPAHPNPFNSTTTLHYSLPTPQHVTLEVFDIQGREVATLVDGVQSAGEHQVTFDGAGLASGVYLVKLEAASSGSGATPNKVVQKLVLLK